MNNSNNHTIIKRRIRIKCNCHPLSDRTFEMVFIYHGMQSNRMDISRDVDMPVNMLCRNCNLAEKEPEVAFALPS